MTTSTHLSQLEALTKKAESLVLSLQSAKIHPSKDQYKTFNTLSLRLCGAAAAVPTEIEALKERRTDSSREEGRKLISQAQSDRTTLFVTTELKNRAVFVRNIKLFFEGPLDSGIDSGTIKGRKRLTRERCERICSLSRDGLLSWAVAFAPSIWMANTMSNNTFDYLEEHIEPEHPLEWPSEIYDILRTVGGELPLRGSCKYQEFLKGKIDLNEW